MGRADGWRAFSFVGAAVGQPEGRDGEGGAGVTLGIRRYLDMSMTQW